jgi:hypothetical protein
MMRAVVSVVLAVAASLVPARAQEPAPAAPGWDLLPRDLLYAPYVADISRPTFGLAFMNVQDVGIASSGDARHLVSLGARAGLVRWRPGWTPRLALQLDIYAGFHGQFDRDFDTDNIGWDGIYGLVGTARIHETLALKFGVDHVSSHVGDEYAERTGRERINYTREELLLGVSWRFAPRWRLYAEVANAHDLRNELLQEEGRWKAGLEFEQPEGLLGTRLGWYAAVDVEAMEERDWESDVSAQLGLLLPSRTRDWRIGVAWYDGRVPIGEFFQDDERYFAVGLWLDI